MKGCWVWVWVWVWVWGQVRLRKGGLAIAHPLRGVRLRNGGGTLRVNPLRKRGAKGFTPWRTHCALHSVKTRYGYPRLLAHGINQLYRPRLNQETS